MRSESSCSTSSSGISGDKRALKSTLDCSFTSSAFSADTALCSDPIAKTGSWPPFFPYQADTRTTQSQTFITHLDLQNDVDDKIGCHPSLHHRLWHGLHNQRPQSRQSANFPCLKYITTGVPFSPCHKSHTLRYSGLRTPPTIRRPRKLAIFLAKWGTSIATSCRTHHDYIKVSTFQMMFAVTRNAVMYPPLRG